MKFSYLTNLILATIILIGLSWLFVKPEKADNHHRISELSASDISTIEIIRHDKPLTQVQLNQQQWQLSEPFSARANPTRINLVLSLLQTPVHGKLEMSQLDTTLEKFGLNADSISLKLNDQMFQFGQTDPLKQQRYVKHHQHIYLIDDNIFPLLTASAEDFIDNRLIAKTDTMTQISLPVADSETKFLTLQKRNGTWTSNISSLSTDQLTQLVQAWKNSYAMHVKHLSSDAMNQLPMAQVHIELTQSGNVISLIMTKDSNNLMLTQPETGLQYLFPLALASQLFPKID